ncbi:hypothetical protein NDU88_001419 [Pleurodeles waltl]|uniref:Uncharacterized protein n=1 Tax=Pleurodeles waltl TaxID=8319 RepID=A0AAV7V9S3_PLEWA|nr:hypothetical protein NDU88_001419 [Pleurodeles waltl]
MRKARHDWRASGGRGDQRGQLRLRRLPHRERRRSQRTCFGCHGLRSLLGQSALSRWVASGSCGELCGGLCYLGTLPYLGRREHWPEMESWNGGCGREIRRGKRARHERPAGAPTDPDGEPRGREASTTHEIHTEQDDAMHMSQLSS